MVQKFHPHDRHVGSRLRMRRLMLDMSQANLGEALGVTFQQVQKYENGTSRVAAGRLQQLSRTLRVSVEFFFEGLSRDHLQEDVPTYVNDFLASADGVALMKAYTRLRDRGLRRAIVSLVEALGPELHGDV